MDNLAEKRQYVPPVLEYGVVASAREKAFLVLTEGGCHEAVAATGCVVKPEKDDVVLLSFGGEERIYILSVLERPCGLHRETTLQFDGQVHLNVRGGGMRMTTDEELSFASRGKMILASPKLEVDAHEGTLKIESMSFFGKVLYSQIEKMKVVADAVDSIFRRVVQRMTSSYRYVEEHEEIQSASTRMLVDGTLTMQTKNTMHIAEGHIKIDAEQIHLG
jgi:hypothetical protein